MKKAQKSVSLFFASASRKLDNICRVSGDSRQLDVLLKRHPYLDLEETDDEGWSMLHIACLCGHCDIVKYFVEVARVDPLLKSKAHDGMVPFHLACWGGHLEIVKYLVDHVTLDMSSMASKLGNTPLHYAAWGGHTSICVYLCSLNVNVDAVNILEGYSALLMAARCGQLSVVQCLIEACAATMDMTDFQGCNSLYHAAYEGHEAIVGYLLSKGCSCDSLVGATAHNDTPFHSSSIAISPISKVVDAPMSINTSGKESLQDCFVASSECSPVEEMALLNSKPLEKLEKSESRKGKSAKSKSSKKVRKEECMPDEAALALVSNNVSNSEQLAEVELVNDITTDASVIKNDFGFLIPDDSALLYSTNELVLEGFSEVKKVDAVEGAWSELFEGASDDGKSVTSSNLQPLNSLSLNIKDVPEDNIAGVLSSASALSESYGSDADGTNEIVAKLEAETKAWKENKDVAFGYFWGLCSDCNELPELSMMIDECPFDLINSVDAADGSTNALMKASSAGVVDIISCILNHSSIQTGAIEKVDAMGRTALLRAVGANKLEAVKYLIEHGGANVLVLNPRKLSVIHIAAKCGYYAMLVYLCGRIASIESKKEQDRKDEEVMRVAELPAAGKRLPNPQPHFLRFVDLQDTSGYTALHFACKQGFVDVTELLVSDVRANTTLRTFSHREKACDMASSLAVRCVFLKDRTSRKSILVKSNNNNPTASEGLSSSSNSSRTYGNSSSFNTSSTNSSFKGTSSFKASGSNVFEASNPQPVKSVTRKPTMSLSLNSRLLMQTKSINSKYTKPHMKQDEKYGKLITLADELSDNRSTSTSVPGDDRSVTIASVFGGDEKSVAVAANAWTAPVAAVKEVEKFGNEIAENMKLYSDYMIKTLKPRVGSTGTDDDVGFGDQTCGVAESITGVGARDIVEMEGPGLTVRSEIDENRRMSPSFPTDIIAPSLSEETVNNQRSRMMKISSLDTIASDTSLYIPSMQPVDGPHMVSLDTSDISVITEIDIDLPVAEGQVCQSPDADSPLLETGTTDSTKKLVISPIKLSHISRSTGKSAAVAKPPASASAFSSSANKLKHLSSKLRNNQFLFSANKIEQGTYNEIFPVVFDNQV